MTTLFLRSLPTTVRIHLHKTKRKRSFHSLVPKVEIHLNFFFVIINNNNTLFYEGNIDDSVVYKMALPNLSLKPEKGQYFAKRLKSELYKEIAESSSYVLYPVTGYSSCVNRTLMFFIQGRYGYQPLT